MKYRVDLSVEELEEAESILHKGRHLASIRNRAQALLLRHNGLTDNVISDVTGLKMRTIVNIKKHYCERGFHDTVYGLARSGRPPTYTAKDEAELTALACSDAPEGRTRWTLELLQENMSNKPCKTKIHLMLKKTALNRGAKKCGVSGRSMKNTESECMR